MTLKDNRLEFWAALLMGSLFIPAIGSSSISPKWSILSLVIPILWLRSEACLDRGLWRGWLFALLPFLSIFWSPNVYEALNWVWIYFLLGALYVAAPSLSIRAVYWGFCVGVSLSLPAIILQVLAYWPFPEASSGPTGLFLNKNYLAEAGLAALILAWHLRAWFLMPALMVCFIAPMSRGAIIAFIVVVCIWLWPRMRSAAIAVVLLSIGGLSWYIRALPMPTLDHRLAIWRDTIDGLTLFGHGIGSFRTLYPYFASRTDTYVSRPEFAHNEYLHLAFEHGIFSIVFIPFIWIALKRARETERLLLVAILVMAFFSFPLHLPTTAFIFAIAAGYSALHRPDLR